MKIMIMDGQGGGVGRSLVEAIKEKYPEAVVWILPISPTVGSHTGVGTLVISYFGNQR